MEQLTETARETISATLALANDALGAIEHEVAHLVKRAEHLRQFIRLGDALLGTSAPMSVPAVIVPSRPPTAAEQAQAILAEVGHPMRITDIFQQVEARNGLHGKQPKEALRTALRDHPKVFRHIRRGVYGLVAWKQPMPYGVAGA